MAGPRAEVDRVQQRRRLATTLRQGLPAEPVRRQGVLRAEDAAVAVAVAAPLREQMNARARSGSGSGSGSMTPGMMAMMAMMGPNKGAASARSLAGTGVQKD